jgi:hypothetical protein
MDLTDPRWKGKILSDDFRALGGGVLFSVLQDHFGQDPTTGSTICLGLAATYSPRAPPLEVCGRRPRARSTTVMGPASENLHRSGQSSRRATLPS